MNGKELKVSELEMKFGQQARMVNVFGVFRYLPNNGLYVIYADVGTTYDYVCYGSSHIKNNVILSMNTNKAEDLEAIKEYIYKVVNGESLDNFEIISLDNIEEIELIASKNFEIKREVLAALIEKTIPKKAETTEEAAAKNVKKKKSPLVTILVLLLFIIIGGAGFFIYTTMMESSKISNVIVCKKSYPFEEIDSVTLEEEDTYQFDNSNKLKKVEDINRYVFSDDSVYLDFINEAKYWHYMPEEKKNVSGGYKLDDETKTFITSTVTIVDSSYENSIEYEEILSMNTGDGYKCEEKIEK